MQNAGNQLRVELDNNISLGDVLGILDYIMIESPPLRFSENNATISSSTGHSRNTISKTIQKAKQLAIRVARDSDPLPSARLEPTGMLHHQPVAELVHKAPAGEWLDLLPTGERRLPGPSSRGPLPVSSLKSSMLDSCTRFAKL